MTKFTPDEEKVITAYNSIFVQLFASQEEQILNQLYSEFKNGKKDLLPFVAQFALLREQKREFITVLRNQEGEN